MADALALRIVEDARWPAGTTFRLWPGCDLTIGNDFQSELAIGPVSSPAFAQRKAHVNAIATGGFEIRSDRIMEEIFVDEVRTYRKELKRGQRIRFGGSTLEVIDFVLDAASVRGCPACGVPIDFLRRPLPGRIACDACRAVIRMGDGSIEVAGAVRVRLDETLRRAIDEESVDAWAETVRADASIPDWVLELDDVTALAKPWLDRFVGRSGVLRTDAPVEPWGDAFRDPFRRLHEDAPGPTSTWLEWVAGGSTLRVETALVRYLIVRVPVALLRGPGDRVIHRAPTAPGITARCHWSLLRLPGT